MTSFAQARCIVAVLLATACAAGSSGPDRAATFLSPAPPPAGRVCHPAGSPEGLPPADALIDSAGVVNSLKPGAGGQAGYALFSLRFDNQGHIMSFRTVEFTLAPQRDTEVEQLTLNRVRAQPAGDPWSVRLKVTSDTAPRIQVGRSEVCPALIVGTLDVMTRTSVTSTRSRGRQPSTPTEQPQGTPHFIVLVDSTGKLVDLKLTQSSGFPDVDQQVESSLRGKSFHPTLLDGAPIAAWTQWPPAEQ